MATVSVTKSINVSANDAWSKLAAFGGIENYSPIAKSVVKGEGEGAKRTCTMPDGAEINEVLNTLDNSKKHLQYAILSGPFPITDYVSNVNVKEIDLGNCEITWDCSFNSAPEAEGDMKGLFEGFYKVIIENLEEYIQKN